VPPLGDPPALPGADRHVGGDRTGDGRDDIDARDRNSWRIAISKIPKQIGSGPLRPVAETELNVGYRLVVPSAEAPPTS